MAGRKEIRTRIQSVKNTQKITKAMKMIAATKLRRAQNTMFSIRAYADEFSKTAHYIVDKVEKIHPLMVKHEKIQKEAIVVVSGDRGLCGSFNANISRHTRRYVESRKHEGVEISLYFVGKKAYESLKSLDVVKNTEFMGLFKDLQFVYMYDLVDLLSEKYKRGEFDLVSVVFNKFKSAIAQEVTTSQIFPLDHDVFKNHKAKKDDLGRDLLIEPSIEGLLDFMVPRYAATELFHSFMESLASELSARMNAMDSATKNADEMITKLVLLYNKLRQNAITTELMEITGGAEALKG